ncbi:hypothetical protein LZP73_15855 [Shewanella sp. AS16]|uniref:hypothetical protein n=1 Tax=Shewanella sp. AS16 TaxID=2907625 RepID=UPI001F2287FF|nr:hypothetical protein [Shewanella sp. AS16]MCE9687663.1 hypothetical protein [Shewanella sp. AS16]
MKSMIINTGSPRLGAILFSTLLVCSIAGCASKGKQPKAMPPAPSFGPPKIIQMRDIGAIAPTGNSVADMASDGNIYPGEWLAIEGKFIAESQFQIDGQTLVPARLTAKAMLVRVPAGLSPVKLHKLVLTNAHGTATREFHTRHYIAATDTDENRLHFLRTDPATKGYIEMDSAYEMELTQKRALLSQISPSHGFLYSFGIISREKVSREKAATETGMAYKVSLQTIHLAAAGMPAVIDETEIALSSQPTSVSMDDKGRLVLLGARDLVFIDVSEETHPKIMAKLALPATSGKELYMDALFLNQGKHLALMETTQNRLLIYDIADLARPALVAQQRVYPKADMPLLVDILADPAQSNRFWVLAGANLRILDEQLQDLYSRVMDGSQADEAHEVSEQLIAFEFKDGALIPGKTIDLPENFVPFFGISGPDKRLYVSGFNGEFLDFKTLTLDMGLVKNMFLSLVNTVQFGRILAIDPKSGQIQNQAQGLGLYYHLDYMPDLGPVYALYKLSGKMFAPFVKVKWGIGVSSRGTFSIRDGSANSIFPPYSVGYISLQ